MELQISAASQRFICFSSRGKERGKKKQAAAGALPAPASPGRLYGYVKRRRRRRYEFLLRLDETAAADVIACLLAGWNAAICRRWRVRPSTEAAAT